MFVFSNLATTVDGKIGFADRSHHPLGTALDRRHMRELRGEADAVLFGAATLRAYRKFCGVGRGHPEQPMNVVISSGLEGISPLWPFFSRPDRRRILFTGSETPTRVVDKFEKKSSVQILVRPTTKNSRARQILNHLSGLGVRRLLIEGGGSVMWDFASQDLIDEYHVTVTPHILGGIASPTLVDGKGFAPGRQLALKLVQCRIRGDELYLTYRRRVGDPS